MKQLCDILYPYQRRFFQDRRRRKIWISARQVGKSLTIAGMLVRKALGRPGGLSLCVSTGRRAAQEIIKKCAQWAEGVRLMTGQAIKFQASADRIQFSNGCRVLSLPSVPASLRGFTAQCVCVDEAAYVDGLDEVLQAIGPTLTRDAEAELVLASTPAGRNGAFWELWRKAQEDDAWYAQTTTIEDAAADGLEVDMDALRELCPDPQAFAVEYMCQFADQYSSFIDCSLLQFADAPAAKVVARHMGMDVGSTGDRTAVATVDELADGTFFVEDIAVMRNAEYTRQLEVLGQLNAKFQWRSGYVDSVGIGNPIAEFANKKVSARIKGFAWSKANKTKVHEHCRSLVFDRKLVFASGLRPLVTCDFQNISRLVSEAGDVSYVAGRGPNGHSDAASALFLGLWSAHDGPASMSVPSGWGRPSAFGGWGSRL